jgi:hypothetical protein
MKKFLCLIVSYISAVTFLHFFVFADSPPCRPGGPNGNLYKLDTNGKLLLDENGEKIPASGYSDLVLFNKCCNKKIKLICRNEDCIKGISYYHKIKPYKLGKCKQGLPFCKKCYYTDSGVKKANRPACERDDYYKPDLSNSTYPCHKDNYVKTVYYYDHSTTDDCF